MLQRALKNAPSRSAGLREHTLGNYGANPQIVAAIAGAVPEHPEPVVKPVRARNEAVGIARAGAQGVITHIQVLSGFLEELELVEQSFL